MQINTQLIEKQEMDPDGNLLVNSIFYTIQGEGPFAGRPAVFVRLAGCNLQCPQCDTEYTKRILYTPSSIFERIDNLIHDNNVKLGANKMLVVITGGEPFRQNLRPLTDLLLSKKLTVQLETNGTLFQVLDERLFIVCSPKTGKINKRLIPFITAFKYVISADSVDIDGLPLTALGHPNSGSVYKYYEDAPFADCYIQPADHQDPLKNKENLEAAKQSVMVNNRLLCIQTHKIIGVE